MIVGINASGYPTPITSGLVGKRANRRAQGTGNDHRLRRTVINRKLEPCTDQSLALCLAPAGHIPMLPKIRARDAARCQGVSSQVSANSIPRIAERRFDKDETMAQDTGGGVIGPDLTKGIAAAELADGGRLLGRVGDDQVLLVRRGAEVFAVAAQCTHYSGPLVDGLLVGDTVRCPWHHACFDLRTGEALRAPAFSPLETWSVEQRDGAIFVQRKRERAAASPPLKASADSPRNIVIIGGGAAGFAAAEKLRRESYQGSLVMLSDDDAAPIDRPNLSKDYLAGSAPEEWLPLRPDSFYSENHIDLRLGSRVTGIDVQSRQVMLAGRNTVSYDRLLIATGAEPVRLSVPGAEQPQVFTLRTLSDCRAIIERAKTARRVVVMGASFIGLEVAAALRTRGIEVHVVAPDKRPMERQLGPEMGDFVRSLHEAHGVVFHLEDTATAIDGHQVKLKGGDSLAADLVVVGIGVRPRVELAQKAGLSIDRGVLVNAYLQTSAPAICAAGDIARWPDPYSGQNIRVEHWVAAERQGQSAALNMLGRQERFAAVPFFWSQHYDTRINYVGHADTWEQIAIEGDLTAGDCVLRFKRAGHVLAVASISRDIDSLQAELAMERAAAITKAIG
jgi:NADPH-dependent 2,4-dienoyl-CoA reductase/sulfur reductase-like enzyme/nitrite reductase/ring-hydroxylating ferredoxin subunit